ncbi:tRNA-specific 2-thiouridylase MnmA protein [Marine Group I thaumarchaeote SCGC AAA799-E16]|uniref:tRNA-specific 2-thiouridylase MnmA protein n=5 Tax=Marine Group I TaxID=905826 RepID=A0A087S7I1_9ARCH|nr:tRNA-specific 2-thiouridylase MnmA protein [Marine Group I thaumarchaeote SCGC AAA799-N04]KER05490.1 tRNA-specific 2-thiouridylase MnmA protein [Marine Group I thaumarchaeote SCGC AAA799-E16]KFM16926.1 tRNA-specific 2-thiouridylase MnmA protein [Marine Group I thaumarchaeote SCGC AAA799-D11]KFM18617.1 tRNA-specific 2-thiouridylase MnmA protein [Marine Group I thaumarchaeote SCGC RSA3]KFM21685.1 tRNA-specific 2-thiouridylase MnmA protein [Marine Group I thaumarchaeote SCGC AAA799-B03]
MKLASLFSGGKDSTYAIYLAQKQGHEIKCLLSIFTKSEESHLLHHPNIQWTKLQAESMKIPQITVNSKSDDTNDELSLLENLLKTAKDEYGIEGLVHGGIKSNFQKEKFEKVCSKYGLTVVAPLWNLDSEQYMNDLLEANFVFVMITVSSDGLDDSWLGKVIGTTEIKTLKELSDKFGFNLNFEGGEAETFVIDCPLFSNSIKINRAEKKWDGYRGRFEIVDAELNYNA